MYLNQLCEQLLRWLTAALLPGPGSTERPAVCTGTQHADSSLPGGGPQAHPLGLSSALRISAFRGGP